MFNDPTTERSDRVMAFWLMLTLAAAFLFFFSGRFHSIDEVSSVALADTIITQGQAHIDQITWSQTLPLPEGTYGRDGVLYSKKGIGWSLLIAPLQLLAHWLPGVGVVGMVMLTNWWITTLTGGLLYLLVRRLGYRQSTGIFVTLAWAFGTLALVYSKTLFNSTFGALVLVAVTLLLLARSNDFSRSGAPRTTEVVTTSAAGALLGWLLLTRPENALTVPVFAAFLFFTSAGSIRQRLLRGLVFGVPITLAVGLILGFNWFRFGSLLDFGYDMSEESGGNAAIALMGLLFSPGRSLFVYMPLLLPAFWGLTHLLRSTAERAQPRTENGSSGICSQICPAEQDKYHSEETRNLWRAKREIPRFLGMTSKQAERPHRRKAVGWLVLAFTGIYLFFFAPSVDWWGGWNWGIRYWVPLLPLWCLGLAPLWERARWRRGVLFLSVLSFLIQLLGVLIDFNLPLGQDVSEQVSLDAQLWTLADSQIANHLRLLPDWSQWDLVWVVTNSWELAIAGIMLLLGALWGLRRAINGQPSTTWGLMCSAALLLLLALTQIRALDDPKWSAYEPEFAPLLTYLEHAPPNSVLLFEMHVYHDYFDRVQAWFNLNRSGVRHVQLLQQPVPDATQSALLERATTNAQTIFLLTEGTPPGDPNSGTERWLSERAFLAHNEWIGEFSRLTIFSIAPTDSLQPLISTPIRLEDGITLLQASKSDDQSAPLRHGDSLLVALDWQAEQVPSTDYIVFLQLLGSTGIVAQQYSSPQANFAPTSSWEIGQLIQDRRTLTLPDVPPGDYTLIAGMYHPNTGQRLAVNNQGHTISLGTVRIGE